MAEIAGLYTTFKEVYLLSRSIYRACQTARASDDERKKLQDDVHFEMSYIQHFGRYYLASGRIAEDKHLDQVGPAYICSQTAVCG